MRFENSPIVLERANRSTLAVHDWRARDDPEENSVEKSGERARHTPRGSSWRYRLAGGGARRHDSVGSSTTAPTKQPPLSFNPSSPSGSPSKPLDTPPTRLLPPSWPWIRSIRPVVPPLSLPRPPPPTPPDVPRPSSRCLGPTNAILIGRKGGIQPRNDFQRCPGHVPCVTCLSPFPSPPSPPLVLVHS